MLKIEICAESKAAPVPDAHAGNLTQKNVHRGSRGRGILRYTFRIKRKEGTRRARGKG